MAAAIVADCGADVFGNGIEVADQFIGRFAGQFGMLLDGGIQILYVGTMMHVVVQSHRLLIDDGF